MKNTTPHIDTNITYILWWGSSAYTSSREMRENLKKILDTAGVKYICIEENDTAEELRTRGDEYTFELCTRRNITALRETKFTHIITPCPHSYHVITHYYPQYGYTAHIWHHTDFIAALLREGLLSPQHKLSPSRITYHDPCRLSRIGHTSSIREIIKILGGELCEAPHHGINSMCCGGGAYMDTSPIPTKISIIRYEELLSTGVNTIITSCPICHDMLSAARTGDKTRITDIATIVAETVCHSL